MSLKAHLSCFLLIAASGGSLLMGQEYVGFQAGISQPLSESGTWVDRHPGFTLGVQELSDQGGGTLFRPRLDVVRFKGQGTSTVQGVSGPIQASLDNTFTIVSLGLESLYYFMEDINRGPYVLGGIGGASTRLVSRVAASPDGGGANWPASGTLVNTSNRFYYALGFGYQFNNHVGSEVRYFATRWGMGETYIRVSDITASVTLRFP